MRFRQRLATWAVTGFFQQAFVVGVGALAALILVAAAIAAFGSLAVRAVLPTIDRHVEQGWIDALGPLSTLSDRYPRQEKNFSARHTEVIAADLGIAVAAENDAAAPIPDREQVAAFTSIRASLLPDGTGLTRPTANQARNAWLLRHRAELDALADSIVDGESPVWAMDLSDCVGNLEVALAGLVDLQRAVLGSASSSIESGDLDRAARLLEASWRLNDTLLRSPRLDEHLASVTIVEEQMTVLRQHPDPGSHWKIRLAALDLERRALEAVRLDAWLLRCRAASFLNNLHPVLGLFAQPFARLLAVPQHQAMVWAVEELPTRDVTRFDPDRFVAEQHRRIPRWNVLARSGLPDDWRFWLESVRGSLAVELALRTMELKDAVRGPAGFDATQLAPRQPSRVVGIDWIYTTEHGQVEITLDDGSWAGGGAPRLRAVVELSIQAASGGGA